MFAICVRETLSQLEELKSVRHVAVHAAHAAQRQATASLVQQDMDSLAVIATPAQEQLFPLEETTFVLAASQAVLLALILTEFVILVQQGINI